MSRISPINFLIKHRSLIIRTYSQNDTKLQKTWDRLQESLPSLSETMLVNTFKQYMSVLIVFDREIGTVIQKLDKINEQKAKLEEQVQDFSERLDKVKQEKDRVTQKTRSDVQVTQELDNPPKRVKGWSVQKSKDGYYRCYRKIKGKVLSIYVGKSFDLKKATVRITAKEEGIGVTQKLDNESNPI